MENWQLDKQRQSLELIDRLEQSIINCLQEQPTGQKEALLQEHRVYKRFAQIKARSGVLASWFSSVELVNEAKTLDTADPIQSFRDSLLLLEDRYAKLNNGEDWVPQPISFNDSDPQLVQTELEKLELLFSGEEQFGKYVDLHEHHAQFLTLKNAAKLSYVDYLNRIDDFSLIPDNVKNTVQFLSYLKGLVDYFVSFLQRSRPLFAVEEKVVAWKSSLQEKATKQTLYCFACAKTFSNENVHKSHFQSRKHLNNLNVLKSKRGVDDLTDDVLRDMGQQYLARRAEFDFQIAEQTFLLSRLKSELADTISKTCANIERKQSLTGREWLAEPDQVVDSAKSDSDTEDHAKNPLKLPLGWDGKPIPYWIYRLHGLSVEYECEICGGYSYRGRLAFDRHFQEPRHLRGLQCLGIPNLKFLHDITSISEANDMWQGWKEKQKKEMFIPEAMEECEDDTGNVFDKKTFQDLKSQGLL